MVDMQRVPLVKRKKILLGNYPNLRNNIVVSTMNIRLGPTYQIALVITSQHFRDDVITSNHTDLAGSSPYL